MSEDIAKLANKAKKVIKDITYITLATSSSKGEPWNSPVYSAFDKSYNFYWASWTENQHSRNIMENNKVFVVVYDSRVVEGTGFGVYIKGKACQLNHIEEIKNAISLMYKRKGKNARSPEQFLRKFPRRIFKFVPEKVWVNSSGEVKGNFVDKRVDITNAILPKS